MQKNEVNILIVEDDVTQREALSEAVKRRGFRAVPVGKPDEAESLAKVKPIHAALEKARTNFHDAGCHGRLCDCDPLHVSGGPCCHAGLVVDEVRALIYPLLSAAAIEAL
ncbi:MAG: hypothetical protein AABZ31_14995 [Bdellovibrionota bacterium]